MTPHAHHNNDLYLSAYTAELTRDLTEAHDADRTGHSGIRFSIAQSFVRFGAWLLPETPELVDGRILVLDIGGADRGHQRAA
jgi:hypothetical protein